MYRELLDFKGNQAFHLSCYARGAPYFEWTAQTLGAGTPKLF